MGTLAGRKIALLEHRHRDELAALVERLGGVPISAPAVGEVACHDDLGTFVDGLTARRFSIAVFLSGAGPATLLAEADRRGRLGEVLAALRQVTIACRGAKPLTALKRYGLRAQITTARPHTTREIIAALSSIDVTDRGVVLVHYGERNLAIAEELQRRGARLKEVCPYSWALPDDLGPVAGVVRDAIAHRLDAVLFTSQVQCRNLFQIASEMSRAQGLALSLNRHVVVGAVGPVCAGALQRVGVTPDVVPASPNMPALIHAIAQYFDQDARGSGDENA
jgi:uroporphyrinogen-III synthase